MLPVWTPRAVTVGTCITSAAPLTLTHCPHRHPPHGYQPDPLSLSLSLSTGSSSFSCSQPSSWTAANGGRPWTPQLKVLQAIGSEGRKTDWEICKDSFSFSIHLCSCALFISVPLPLALSLSLSLSQSGVKKWLFLLPERAKVGENATW